MTTVCIISKWTRKINSDQLNLLYVSLASQQQQINSLKERERYEDGEKEREREINITRTVNITKHSVHSILYMFLEFLRKISFANQGFWCNQSIHISNFK